jgi:hypothetical protein
MKIQIEEKINKLVLVICFIGLVRIYSKEKIESLSTFPICCKVIVKYGAVQ